MEETVKSSLTGGLFAFLVSMTWLDLLTQMGLAFFLGGVGAAGGLAFNELIKYLKRNKNEKAKNK